MAPPSTGIIAPVMWDAAGESRNAAGRPPELLRLAVPAQRDVLRQPGAHLVRISLQSIKFPDPFGSYPDRQQRVDPDPGRAEFSGQTAGRPPSG